MRKKSIDHNDALPFTGKDGNETHQCIAQTDKPHLWELRWKETHGVSKQMG
jgi:hypothetical protein